MKKVIILGSAHPLRGGGISTFNERLAKAFLDEGHDVTVFSFSLQYPAFLFPGRSQFSNEAPPEGIAIKTLVNSINPANWVRVGRKLRKLKPDLLIVRFWTPFMAPCLATIASISRKNLHTRVVAITDNVIPHEKGLFDKPLTKYFLKRMHGFVTMSNAVKNDLMRFGVAAEKIETCPHPLYDNLGHKLPMKEARQLLGLEPEEKILLFFGFIRDYKGLDLLLQSLARPEVKALNIKLLVAGEFYCKPKPYFEMVERLGLQNNIKWHHHFIANNEVNRYFSAANLVAQPYKRATQSGVTQLAYHFDVPMLVTNVGALPEMVANEKGGYVVEPKPDEIARAIKRYFNEDKETEFRKFVNEEKKRFSWKNIVAAIDKAALNTKTWTSTLLTK